MQIFLSHATVDRELVTQVKTAIGTLATVYCTEDDIQAGFDVHAKIQEQIRKSELMIVLLSNQGAQSIYLHQEIGFANSAGKLIIPVVAAGLPSGGLGMLEGIEYIQIDDREDWLTRLSTHVERLVRESEAKKAKADKTTTDLVVAIVAMAAVLWAVRQM